MLVKQRWGVFCFFSQSQLNSVTDTNVKRQEVSILGFYQDVCIQWVQHCVADELLCHGDGLVHGHAQVRQVVQEPEEKLKVPSDFAHTQSHPLQLNTFSTATLPPILSLGYLR